MSPVGVMNEKNLIMVLPNNAPGAIETSNCVSLDSTTDTITAHSGGTQAAAVPLTTKLNRVTVVAAGGDSVALPPALAGLVVKVVNAGGANSMNVFTFYNAGTPTDTINALSATTAFAIANATTVTFTCYTTGKWVTN